MSRSMEREEGQSQPVCPVCRSTDVRMFLQVPSMPVFANVLWNTREEALTAARGDLDLGYCDSCGHVYNFAFDPELLEYGASYENSLHYSGRFQRYAEDLANELIDRFGLYGRDIVEIGCGQGDFLRLLCEGGGNRGTGFDPGHRPEDRPATNAKVRFFTDLYDERHADIPADFVVCRHVLEHVQDPAEFLEGLRRTLGADRRAGIFFEVPDVEYTLRALAIWDLIYEHCSYFSEPSIARLFSERGFAVRRTFGTFGGQFLCIEAGWGDADPANGPMVSGPAATRTEAETGAIAAPSVADDGGSVTRPPAGPGSAGAPRPATNGRIPDRSAASAEGVPLELAAAIDAFPPRYAEKVETWRRTFARIRGEGRKAVVWGAGSKGVTILNVLRDAETVEYVVDLNPRKHGMYVSGSGQQIVPPEFLCSYRPDVVVAMNSIYENEIRALLAELGVEAQLVMA